MISKYLLVLHQDVDKYLSDGWQPYGSPVLAQSIIWQAVVKYRATQLMSEEEIL